MRTEIETILLSKIVDQNTIKIMIAQWKKSGSKIVFTNGVFDLLHIGHLTYMTKAAELGDKLVIGLNSDNSVKRLKGENRPINSQNTRAALLASMFFIDAIILFEEDTPLDLINCLLPDVLVKGADYSVDKIVGAQIVLANGGVVKTIEFIEGHSSSAIIKKINLQI